MRNFSKTICTLGTLALMGFGVNGCANHQNVYSIAIVLGVFTFLAIRSEY